MSTPAAVAEGEDAGSGHLPRNVRRFIVLLALVQGLLLYLASHGHDQGWWPFSLLGGRIYWYALVLSVPTTMLLSVRDLREPRFWQHAALVAGVFMLLAGWAAWSSTGDPGIQTSDVLGPFGASMAAALFVALPYLQCRQAQGRWCAPYPRLFELAWQNALTLILTLLFVGICWAVLWLWGALFKLIGIGLFSELFQREAFIYMATGVMVGLGILIGRTQQRPVQVARRILFAIFTGLLPLLSAVAVLFIASLPFTGLQPLWDTRSAAFTLMSLVGVLVLFVNAVYQDGDEPLPYPRWLQRVVDAGLLVLPLFALLALYAMALRIGQHGWTQARLAGVIAASILAAHAIGYAGAVLRSRTGWLSGLKPVNVWVSLAAIAITVAVNSPLLDPHRIAVGSQLARLHDGRTLPADVDLDFLRFASGRLGVRALRGLQDEPRMQADAGLAQRMAQVLARPARYQTPAEQQRSAERDPQALQSRIPVVPTGEAVADGWWQVLAAGTLDFEGSGSCRQPGADCVAVLRDFDGDGRHEILLCNLQQRDFPMCVLYAGADNHWRRAGQFNFYRHHGTPQAMPSVVQALREGRVELRRQRWPDIEVGGLRSRLEGDNGTGMAE